MQIILVSSRLKAARTFTIMPRHILALLAVLSVLVFSTSAIFSWLSVHLRWPLVEEMMLSLQRQESSKSDLFVSNNLQVMATRIGELQAQVLQLDALSERVAGLAGIKREALPSMARQGLGGPYLPAPVDSANLQAAIERLASDVENRGEVLAVLESRLLEKRVRDRLLPTTMPVRDAVLGSAFGYRTDPIDGSRALHEGIDLAADVGTPVVVAADGVVLASGFHPEYGNVLDVDHGDGLVSRYAHLSRIDVLAGRLVKRGETIGAVGSTGRSTGAHLHFEVRMFGAAQDPAIFLRQGAEYAQLKHH